MQAALMPVNNTTNPATRYVSRGPIVNSPAFPVGYCRVEKAPTRSLRLGKSKYVKVPRRIKLREIPSWWSTIALRSIPPMLSLSTVCPFCLRVKNPAGLAHRAISSTPPPVFEFLDLLLGPFCAEVEYTICFSGVEPLVMLAWPLGIGCVAGTSCRPGPACACSMVGYWVTAEAIRVASDSNSQFVLSVRSGNPQTRSNGPDRFQCSGMSPVL
jgi:hypothetical protein